MSADVNVLSRTQVITVNPESRSVSVTNAGPQGPPGGDTAALESRVDDLETADTGLAADVSALETLTGTHTTDIDAVEASAAALSTSKVAKAGDTMTGKLNLPAASGLGLGTLTAVENIEGGMKHFTIDGIFRNFHPVVFRSLVGISDHNGTISGGASGGLTNGIPRITFAKPGTKTVKWIEEAPAGWDVCRTSFCVNKEAAGTGNVHWRLSYQILNFLSGSDMDNGAMTQVYDANVAVHATTGVGIYTITTGSFPTSPQAFGIPPVLSIALQRIDDAGDTYAGAVSIDFVSLSFL